MTNQEIAQMILAPIIAEMRAGFVEAAVGADLNAQGDQLRREAAANVRLLDEIANRVSGLLYE